MENIILIPFSINSLRELIEETIQSALASYEKSRPQQQQNELLTQREVAKLLDVSVTTIIKWKSLNLLPYHKVNSRVYYRKNDVLEAMAKFSGGGANGY